ncbi:carboxypeptidase regulatory-like domain-containing protein [Microbacterium enclense]|uniref:carboxypeptidase regulatory-like domain-containing protein n=1 Tax=Microbacterium enclense TaxID=993073 RepID=UPI003D76578C
MSIAGRISSPSGSTLPTTGIVVRAFPANDPWREAASTTAASTGKYTLSGLPAGSYVLQVDTDPGTGLLDEWYNDKSDRYSADRVSLVAGVNKTGVNVTLAKAASISGLVTVPTGTPGGASSVFVAAYDASHSWIGSANVDEDGTYTIGSLPAGPIVLQFTATSDSGLLDEWFNDKRDFATADAITLAPGEKRTGVDAGLAKGATINGRVSVPSGVTIADWTIRVSAVSAGRDWGKSAYVSSDGTYRLSGLDAGDYRLQFDADSTTGLLDEWYNNATGFDSARVVTVAAGAARAGVNVTLARGASISGRLSVPSGSSPTDVTVQVSDATQETVGYANVASDGTYSVRGLPSGSLRVHFTAMSPSTLQSEWWDDKPDFASATPVVLTAGQARNGVDATLAPGASISGRITAPAGYAVAGGSVEVHTSEFGPSVWGNIAADGSFSVTGLPAGTYRVKFQPPWNSALLPEWYDDASRYADASPITLTTGQTRAGVNAAFALGGTITGTVTVPAGTPRGSNGTTLRVSASLDSGGSGSYFSAEVAPDGSYALRGLPAGQYRVSFQSPDAWGLIDEYYDDATGYYDATLVPVASGQTVSGINAALAAGGSISGRVTLPSGVKVDSMQYRVTAYGPQMSYVDSIGINSDGTYALRGLPAGTYRLEFSTPSDSVVLPEWYTDKSQFWSADSLTLSAGQSLVNVDAVLDKAGAVKGFVRDAAGAAVADAQVSLYARSGSVWEWQESVIADSTGAYVFTGLSPATYTLGFTPPAGSAMLPEWWNDSPDKSTATGIGLTAGQVRGSLVATLATGGTVTGAVRSADGSPLADAEIRVSSRAGLTLASGRTDAAGAYVVAGLPAGDAAVAVVTSAGQTFANGATSLVSASFQTVAPGRSTTVDIALGGRSITGVISAADTGAPLTGGTVTLYSSTGAIGAEATIGKTGAYAFRNVPRGTYAVLIRPAGEAYAPTWSDGASSSADADYFSMSTSSLKKNFSVLRAGSITGKATSTQQWGLTLELWQFSGGTWTWIDSSWSQSGTAFTFAGLAPGVYAVTAFSEGRGDPEAAPRIDVGAGATVDVGTVTNVPVTAGILRGTVAGIRAASDVRVVATTADGKSYSAGVQRKIDKTFAYSFPALPSGSYTVRVTSPTAPVAWYGGSDAASARRVAVTTGGTTTASVTVAAGTASLVGTITGPGGAAVGGTSVSLVEVGATGDSVDSRYIVTGADGRYAFPSMLVPGHSYRVSASGPTGMVDARLVARAGSQTQDLVFAAGARVKGTVVDAVSGAVVAGAPVRVVRDGDTGGYDGFPTVTDSKGRYDIPNLPSGTYRVQVGAWGDSGSAPSGAGAAYGPEWIDDAVTQGAAKPLVVSVGAVVTAPTTRLSAGGVLTGRVRALVAGGGYAWMTDAHVTVKSVTGETVLSGDASASGSPGAFSLVLAPGTYRLCASVPDWVPGHARFTEVCNSSTVTVVAGATTPSTTVTLTERKG